MTAMKENGKNMAESRDFRTKRNEAGIWKLKRMKRKSERGRCL
jgi:hypothetical protein